jgi:hypothetical protein
LMPPAALVALTQSWKTVLASAVEPEATPVKVPMAPTMKGVPLAALVALAPPVALAGALAAVLAGALAGALLELDDEDEQPAAVSAAIASTAAAAPVDLCPARLRPVSLRVIFASFSALVPGRSGRLNLMFKCSGRSASGSRNKLNDLSTVGLAGRPGKG